MRENILLIDDDPAEADTVRTALANSGKVSFQVSWVRCCSQGLDRLAAENKLREARQTPAIAAILLDLYLRDSCGIETFNRLFRAAPRIPILVLAAAQDEHVARAAVKHGAQDYLLKSIYCRYLLPQAVRSMVERSGHPRLHGRPLRDDI